LASTPESKVKKSVKSVLESLGAYYVMPVTSGFGRSGAPDFLVCLNGRFIGIECKAGNKRPTALQLDNLEQIEKCGGLSLVINEENVVHLVHYLKGAVNA
jgi:Holliday junction resolvase